MSDFKIGVLGGTFNPIHNGHIYLGENFARALSLNKVLLVPTYTPPHKCARNLAPPTHRLNMCKLVAGLSDIFEVSDIEIARKGKSYTVDTLKKLSQLYPKADIFLLTGADMFTTLLEWKNYKDIFALATVCAAPRDKKNAAVLQNYAKQLKKLGARTFILDVPVKDISSSKIREKLRAGQGIGELVPLVVENYIKENRLYTR